MRLISHGVACICMFLCILFQNGPVSVTSVAGSSDPSAFRIAVAITCFTSNATINGMLAYGPFKMPDRFSVQQCGQGLGGVFDDWSVHSSIYAHTIATLTDGMVVTRAYGYMYANHDTHFTMVNFVVIIWYVVLGIVSS
jgi:hypothetical protein